MDGVFNNLRTVQGRTCETLKMWESEVKSRMTKQEAIKVLNGLNEQCCEGANIFMTTDWEDRCEALDMAIEALSSQPETDWSYDEDTKEITLIIPKDVYDSAKTIFLSVGYEGQLGLRGMIYSAQPERKKGNWIDTGATPFTNNEGQLIHEKMCSKCKSIAYFRSVCGIMIGNNVCPNCGAEMRGDSDDE